MSESIPTLQIVLTSSVIVVVISAFVSVWIAQITISIENITQERTKWREKVRKKALEVHDALIERNGKKLQQLRLEFKVILNPEDQEDECIIKAIRLPDLPEERENSLSLEFSKRVSLLLKHDWERAKLEAGSIFCRIKCINKLCEWLFKKAERIKYKA